MIRKLTSSGTSSFSKRWQPTTPFEAGLARTVEWYRKNEAWWRAIRDESFDAYYKKHYGRLGLKDATRS